MAKTNYPKGFSDGVTIKGVPILNTYSGNLWWVDSGIGSDGNSGKTPDKPFSTIAYAITRCSSNNGDIILVAPGHAETPTATIAASTAGIKIVGLGTGADRPTMGGLAATPVFTVSAANVLFQNIIFASLETGTQAATQKIYVNAANCSIADCEFNCGASDDVAIHVSTSGDYVQIENNTFRVSANGPDVAIYLEGNSALDGVIIRNNFFDGNSMTNTWDEGHIYSSGVHTNCAIEQNNFLYCSGVGGIEFVAAATGLLRENFAIGTLGQTIDPGSCYCMQNFESDAVDKKARVFPTTEVS